MANESVESRREPRGEFNKKPGVNRRGFLEGAFKTAAVAAIGIAMPNVVEAITNPGTLEDRSTTKELSREIQAIEKRRGNITLDGLFFS